MTGRGRHLLFSIMVAWWLAVPVAAQTAFPTDGLEQRIDFWKQAFTKYGADDLIVHDRFHVNLIYAVATDETVDETVRRVKDGLRGIRDSLSTPESSRKPPRPYARRLWARDWSVRDRCWTNCSIASTHNAASRSDFEPASSDRSATSTRFSGS